MWIFQSQTEQVYGYDLPVFSYTKQCNFVNLFISSMLEVIEPPKEKPFYTQFLRDNAFCEAILSHNLDEAMPFLRESTNKTVLTPYYHIQNNTPQLQYTIVTFIAMYGTYDLLKAAMDLNLNSSPDFCFTRRTLVDCIINFIQSATPQYFKNLSKKMESGLLVIDPNFEAFDYVLKDRYKMLQLALDYGHRGTDKGSLQILKCAQNFYFKHLQQLNFPFEKMTALILYYGSQTFVNELSKFYYTKNECVCLGSGYGTLCHLSKEPNKVKDMVSLYEEDWSKLMLFYCVHKKNLYFAFA